MKIILTITLALIIITIVYSQGPPITTETPVMLGLEGSGIRTFGKFISKENVKSYLQIVAIPYNITPKFQIGGIIPFKFITPNTTETVSGFSDISVFAKYQLYKIDGTAKTFRILANIKQSFPTGRTTSSPPIGAGIYQTYVGLIIGKISTTVGFYSDFGYTITADKDTDNFSYNFSIGVPVLPQKYPQKQINTYLEFNGNYIINSEIHTFYISPGLQFIPGRRILFESSLQLPVLQQNVTTDKINYSMLLGARFLLN